MATSIKQSHISVQQQFYSKSLLHKYNNLLKRVYMSGIDYFRKIKINIQREIYKHQDIFLQFRQIGNVAATSFSANILKILFYFSQGSFSLTVHGSKQSEKFTEKFLFQIHTKGSCRSKIWLPSSKWQPRVLVGGSVIFRALVYDSCLQPVQRESQLA